MSARNTYPLDQSQLYLLASRRRLAQEVFNLELPFVERLAENGDESFRVFDVVQGDKKRQVETPKPILERLHRRLFALLERIEKPSYLHSGVKGLSYITNAKVHRGQVPLVKLDLKKFYPSVKSARVYRFFHETMRCSPDVAGLLSKLTTYDGHLPTGSCVSQLLAYFAARPMFDELHKLAIDHDVRFSIYVDDLTFSGERATPSFLWAAKQVVHSHGFGYHKDRCYAASDQKVVTGVMIDGDRIAVLPSREHEMWRQMRALGSGDLEQRRAAINSLIGTVVAAGQIEARLLIRLRRLRALRSSIDREFKSQNASPMSTQPAPEPR
ncbi:MAG: reverse transcriptase family protein [bacterium]|jgi:hypothetical protein